MQYQNCVLDFENSNRKKIELKCVLKSIVSCPQHNMDTSMQEEYQVSVHELMREMCFWSQTSRKRINITVNVIFYTYHIYHYLQPGRVNF